MVEEVDFSVFDQINPLVVAIDPTGHIARWNPACSSLTGYALDEVRGRKVWDFLVPTAEVEAVRSVFTSLRAGEFPSSFVNDWVTKSGALHKIRWSNTCIVDEKGDLLFVLATGVLVPERPSRPPYEGVRPLPLVLKSAFPMWIFDRGTLEFLAVNDAAVARYGYTREELLSMTIRAIHAPEGLPSLLEELVRVREGVQWTAAVPHRTKGGETLGVELAITPVELRGRPAAMVLVHETK